MKKKIRLIFVTIIMLILGSITTFASSEKVSLNGKTYLIESYMTSTGKIATRISQKSSSGWSKKAQASGVSLSYIAKYKDSLYFNGWSGGKNSLWTYKAGSSKILKKTNSISIVQSSGKYAVAINEEYRTDYSVHKLCIYNLSTGKKKIISNNSIGEKIISGKVYYTKASGNQLIVMRCNLDGSSPKTLVKAKYTVDDIYEVKLYSKYCKIIGWSGKNKTVNYSIAPAASIKLNKTSLTLKLKSTKTATLKATVTGTSKKVTWSSSNKSIATVSSSGKVTAKKAGTVTITAKANGKTAKCKVTVKKSEPLKGWQVAYNKILCNWKTSEKYINLEYLKFYFGSKYKFNRYYLYDLDNNGIPELFLYSTTMDMTVVFTHTSNKLVAVYYGRIYGFNKKEQALLIHGHWHGAGGSQENEYAVYKLYTSKLELTFYIDYAPNGKVTVNSGDGKYRNTTFSEYYTIYNKYIGDSKNVIKCSDIPKKVLSVKIGS